MQPFFPIPELKALNILVDIGNTKETKKKFIPKPMNAP